MNRFRFLLTAAASAMALYFSSSAAVQAQEDKTPVYELRIYTTHDGKLPDLLKRFRDHTCALFEKHGMVNVGYWTPIKQEDGADNKLIYVLQHQSREAAKASFQAFGKDPEWQAARKASEENGKILAKPPESIFMDATAYSPKLEIAKEKEPRVFELRTYTTPEGKLPALHERFKNYTLRLFSKYGMSHIAYWTPSDADQGHDHTLIYILAHPSHEAGLEAFGKFRQDEEWIAAKAKSEENGSLTVPQPEGVKSVYMKATDFSPMQ